MKIASPLETRLLSILGVQRDGTGIERAYRLLHGKKLSRGSLYTTLRRMTSRRWIKTSTDDQDLRRRLFLLTPLGRLEFWNAVRHYQRLSYLKLED